MAKLKYQTFEYIEYPDASKKRAADKWEEKYVFPWLKSGKIIKHDRYTVGATIIDAIITYCARPIDAGLATKAFVQTEHVVKEGEHLYIPFTGCEAYVRRATGKTSNREMIISVLERIGAKSVREQREGERRRWWKISEQELYANIGDGKPGERENDKPDSGGQSSSGSGWNSVVDDIRETESIGHSETDGIPF